MSHALKSLFPRTGTAAAAKWLAAMVITVLLTGCAAGYGRLNFSDDVAQKIENGQVDPNFRYYIAGRSRIPDGIMGLHRDYQLESRLWQPITPTPSELQNLASAVFPYSGNPHPFGAWILDPGGNRIGVWYSQFDNSVVEMLAEGRVRIHSPYNPGGRFASP